MYRKCNSPLSYYPYSYNKIWNELKLHDIRFIAVKFWYEELFLFHCFVHLMCWNTGCSVTQNSWSIYKLGHANHGISHQHAIGFILFLYIYCHITRCHLTSPNRPTLRQSGNEDVVPCGLRSCDDKRYWWWWWWWWLSAHHRLTFSCFIIFDRSTIFILYYFLFAVLVTN